MSFQDKQLKCQDCDASFTFTAGEQEFHAQKGFANEPKRCPDCRSLRKAQKNSQGPARQPRDDGFRGGRPHSGTSGSRSGTGTRASYPATCSRCGAQFEAPFQPKAGRPIYCRSCFEVSRNPGG